VPEEVNLADKRSRTYSWSIILFALGGSATAVQMVKLRTSPEPRPQDVLFLASWFCLALTIALRRPIQYFPWLLVFYSAELVAELATASSWTSLTDYRTLLHVISAICCFISIVTVLCMPLCPKSPLSGPISQFGAKPSSSERSPEDSLRLWQFLSATWVWPLIVIGNERQLQKDDIWTTGYEIQTNRLANRFRDLRQRTIFRKLLRANAVDCCILPLLACVQLALEFSSPLLLHQLLSVMEDPRSGKQDAIVYTVLLFIQGVLSAQFGMLDTWYGRRCFERTRGVLTTKIFDKALSRKTIVGNPSQDDNSKGSARGQSNLINGHSSHKIGPDVENTSQSNEITESTKTTSPNSRIDRETGSSNRTARLLILRELLWGNLTSSGKNSPATTGKVLNLVQSDVTEISQRFLEFSRPMKVLVGLLLAIWLSWILLGPSCLLGILVIIVAQLLNAIITRLQMRWSVYGKQARDARIQISSQYIEALRHLRFYAWQDFWLQKVFEVRRHELNVRFIGSCLSLLTYTLTVYAGALFPVAAFIAYTALAKQQLRIDIIFPALQLFGRVQSRLRELPILVTSLLNAHIAMERIEDFEQEPDVAKLERTDGASRNTIPSLSDCSFAWPGKSSPVLNSINLLLPKGLTLVYGEIGSGKTGNVH
jgi:ABC-type multidrug transport system fused ATPase/permease subunit